MNNLINLLRIKTKKVYPPLLRLINRQSTEEKFLYELSTEDRLTLDNHDYLILMAAVAKKQIKKETYMRAAINDAWASYMVDNLFIDMATMDHFSEEDVEKYIQHCACLSSEFSMNLLTYVIARKRIDIFKTFLICAKEDDISIHKKTIVLIYLSNNKELIDMYETIYLKRKP